MTKQRLIGKYVPDKDGKLRHTLSFIETNINLPTSTSRFNNAFPSITTVSWYKKIWYWMKNNIT